MLNDLRGKAVLITGGTRGIGLATGLAFGRQGAVCTLTHKWGSADEDEIRRQFLEAGAPEPRIVEADAGVPDDTTAVLEGIRSTGATLEVFVSNVAFAQVVRSLDDYQKRSLLRSIEYSVWPLIDYLQQQKRILGRYPRYVVGLSSVGPDKYTANYDFVAASKAVLETLGKYLSFRLAEADVRLNIVRAALVRTESLQATMGEDCVPFIERFDPTMFVTADEVADTVLGLCSGLMDAVTGQIISVDHGCPFYDNMMRLYGERERLDIPKKEK